MHPTAIAPADLLFKRKITTKLPALDGSVSEPSIVSLNVKEKDAREKQKMKENADRRARAKVSTVAVGDTVLVHQKKRNKFTTRFDPSPFEVARIKGTMVTAVRNEKYITRNISQFKKIPSLLEELGEDESDISDNDAEEDGPDEEENDPPDSPHALSPPLAVAGPAVNTSPATTTTKKKLYRYGQNIYDYVTYHSLFEGRGRCNVQSIIITLCHAVLCHTMIRQIRFEEHA